HFRNGLVKLFLAGVAAQDILENRLQLLVDSDQGAPQQAMTGQSPMVAPFSSCDVCFNSIWWFGINPYSLARMGIIRARDCCGAAGRRKLALCSGFAPRH